MQRIAVLMTCYNRVETTLRCLRGLAAQKLPEGVALDIWLVDDGSTDGTGEAVERWWREESRSIESKSKSGVNSPSCESKSKSGMVNILSSTSTSNFNLSDHSSTSTFNFNSFNSNISSLRVIRSQGGLYWCKGMRLAWDAAVARGGSPSLESKSKRGESNILSSTSTSNFNLSEHSSTSILDFDFYLWLNDDVILKPNAIAGLLADYEKVRGVIVGSFSSDETEREVSYGATGKMPDGTPHRGERGMNGNLVLIPREVYEKVGPICGAYSHQYGDYDYGWQVRKHGLEYYSSSSFCGVCPQQPERYHQRLKTYGIIKRVQLLFDPKGYSLHDASLYKYRNWGLARAVLSVVHVTVKVVLAR